MPDSNRRDINQNLAVNYYNFRIIASGILIGIDLAELLDTIIFHEILQWHHMISNIAPLINPAAIRFNNFVDGPFSAFTLIVMVGIALFCQWLQWANTN